MPGSRYLVLAAVFGAIAAAFALFTYGFVRHVVAWDGQSDLLSFGVAVSLMTAVLTLFLWVAKGARAKAQKPGEPASAKVPADE